MPRSRLIPLLDGTSTSGEHRTLAATVKPVRPCLPGKSGHAMRELMRTNDTVRLSWLQALLAAAGIEAVVLDGYTSIMEGSIGASPRRLMVHEADELRARAVIRDAGEAP
ncbi:MAG: DUF2007 domain-containing protein [Stellaceae bacterium]